MSSELIMMKREIARLKSELRHAARDLEDAGLTRKGKYYRKVVGCEAVGEDALIVDNIDGAVQPELPQNSPDTVERGKGV